MHIQKGAFGVESNKSIILELCNIKEALAFEKKKTNELCFQCLEIPVTLCSFRSLYFHMDLDRLF